VRRAPVLALLAALCWAVAAAVAAAPAAAATPEQRGRDLFVSACASCHGVQGGGVPGRGPSVRGAGAASVDFYVGTGRMPLAHPGNQPNRHRPAYDAGAIRDLTAYVTSLAPGGPPIPDVRPQEGDLVTGRRLFADSCAGCHQVAGKGGIGTGFVAPPLADATARQIGEAIRVGPYLMPRFGEEQLSDRDVDSIARYVIAMRTEPRNEGGWSIGNLGPIPEGLVAWLLGAAALVVVIRIIGERAR